MQTIEANLSLVKASDVTIPAAAAAPSLPAMIVVKRGKGTVRVQHFTGSLGAKDLKLAIATKNSGWSKKAVKAEVDKVLRGEKDVREVLAVASLQCAFKEGFVADKMELGKASGALRLTKPVAEAKPVEPAKVLSPAEMLAAMTPEERRALCEQTLAGMK